MGLLTADVPGICDRCGLRYRLMQLKPLEEMGVPFDMLVCPDCWEASHPQDDTRNVRTDDKQQVDNPRPDSIELDQVRELTGTQFDDWIDTIL